MKIIAWAAFWLAAVVGAALGLLILTTRAYDEGFTNGLNLRQRMDAVRDEGLEDAGK